MALYATANTTSSLTAPAGWHLIAATPANDHPWGIYEPGCRNGLVLHGSADCRVSM